MKKISLMKAAQCALFIPILLVCMATMVNGEEKNYQRTVENFMMPDVTLINQDREKVRFKDYMQSDQPVLVDFIFSTCSTICPVLSVSFVNLQRKLGDESGNVRLVSISIDPENDTPRLMKDYLKRYHAKPGWDFLTGSRKDINSVMRAFNAYIPNKMSHYPLMFIRMPRDGTWVRTFGIMSTSELMAEVQQADIR
jgi:protein SCO1